MLRIFNNLKLFFEDNYRRINVREYAKLIKVSPPTASKILESFYKESILRREKDKLYIYYYANKENPIFIDLLTAYWKHVFSSIGLIEFISKEFANPVVILFGSFAKGEINPKSDIDIAIFTKGEKKLNLESFNKKLKREIQIFIFKSREDVSKELLNNILNGYILYGSW